MTMADQDQHTGNAIARPESLPRLIERAAAALAQATTAAEFLDARDRASVAYTAAKMASRLSKAKDAHDTVCAACRKAMADALVIEEQAQIRLADEYDSAQKRGEVAGPGGTGNNQYANVPKENISNTVEDIGLTRKQIHEARFWRDVERDNPGITRKTLDTMLAAGKEPNRAELRRAIAPKPSPPSSPPPQPMPPPRQIAEDRDEDELRLCLAQAYLSGVIRGNRERARAGAIGDVWMDIEEAFDAMSDFVVITLRLIDNGTLTVTGSHNQLEEWNELASVMESIFPEDT
jgi:hypothetical protein